MFAFLCYLVAVGFACWGSSLMPETGHRLLALAFAAAVLPALFHAFQGVRR